eukprot:NODE_5334_length_668_cov_69.532348_g5171_i0.p1 GENE.NODE_5334_length_668_cov_69.532348_g5171_i0~~NODE_5334_length_668_cov_69.532348_g5171_i0.p1  ORF type:complete len:213 (-),score=45.89 NODE_5334_length_668_cov_69.532348_g5171_i0:28-624(-)
MSATQSQVKACVAISKIRDALKNHELLAAEGHTLTAGIASGKATVGTFGCAKMKSFNIMGGLVSYTVALERMANARKMGILIDQSVATTIDHHFEKLIRDRVEWPKFSAKPLIIYELMESKETKADEWMYQLQRIEESSSPYQQHNACFLKFLDGKATAEDMPALAEDPNTAAVIQGWKGKPPSQYLGSMCYCNGQPK